MPSAVCLARLKVCDDRLGCVFVEGMIGGYWALTEKWRPRDPRRERIQSGEIPADKDFDIKHLFPRDLPMESIAAYVETHWGPRNSSRTPAEEAARQAEAREKVKAAKHEEKMNTFDEEQEYKVIHTTDHERRLLGGDTTETAHPMVAGFGVVEKTGRGKKKAAVLPPLADPLA